MNTIQDIEQRVVRYTWWIKISWWLDRVRYFLEQLWNPQHSYNVIHVAGTSGKGTTCWMISHCLYQLWYQVGLTMSPHVLDIRERCMINGQLLPEDIFVSYMNHIKSIIDTTNRSNVWQPSYFEIMIVAALYIFAQQWVDYVVLETWLGGRLDATNVVDSPDKVCIITSIWYDHQKFLWNTLDLIATEKTMIVHPWNRCFTYHQDFWVIDHTIAQVVEQQWGNLGYVQTLPTLLPSYFVWQHNQRNANLAYQTVRYLQHRDNFAQKEYINVLNALSSCPPLPARMQQIQSWTKTFIIDGAHNTQKVSALIQWLGEKFGLEQKYVFILAFKEDKNVGEVLQLILPHASTIICTEFGTKQQDYPLYPIPAEHIQQLCCDQWYTHASVELNHQRIIDSLEENEIIIVTWSFFLTSSFITHLS